MKIGSPAFRRRRRGVLAGLVMLPLSSCGRKQAQPIFLGTDISGVPWGRDFQLLDVDGVQRSLADYRGKVVMLFFGFTHCADVCPLTLARMAQTVREVGDDSARVQGIFVTLDPARDTPAVLARYVPAFHPSFIGLSADSAVIDATAANFKLFFERQKPDENGSYSVDHLGAIYIFDRVGQLRLYFSADAPTEALVHDLRVLL